MLKDNLVMLRSIHSYSQEEIAEKIGISRQAYSKWESGATVPDIEKCRLLAGVYGVTIDSLANPDPEGAAKGDVSLQAANGAAKGDVSLQTAKEDVSLQTLTPKGKNIWGSVIINERGQIVIPKGARDKFGLSGGKRLIVLSDEEGIALVAAERFEEHVQKIMELAYRKSEE